MCASAAGLPRWARGLLTPPDDRVFRFGGLGGLNVFELSRDERTEVLVEELTREVGPWELRDEDFRAPARSKEHSVREPHPALPEERSNQCQTCSHAPSYTEYPSNGRVQGCAETGSAERLDLA